jgi:hypothetical protein
MQKYEALQVLPVDIQARWGAALHKAMPRPGWGAFRLVDVRPTDAKGYQGQRIVVLVLDQDGSPVPNVDVAFAYSTASRYTVDEDFQWSPPHPRKAFVARTGGSGEIDQIQGSPVIDGEPGGISVYLLRPDYPSDVVSGCGMLHDHTGLHLTFQLDSERVVSTLDRLEDIEARLVALEKNRD